MPEAAAVAAAPAIAPPVAPVIAPAKGPVNTAAIPIARAVSKNDVPPTSLKKS